MPGVVVSCKRGTKDVEMSELQAKSDFKRKVLR